MTTSEILSNAASLIAEKRENETLRASLEAATIELHKTRLLCADKRHADLAVERDAALHRVDMMAEEILKVQIEALARERELVAAMEKIVGMKCFGGCSCCLEPVSTARAALQRAKKGGE